MRRACGTSRRRRYLGAAALLLALPFGAAHAQLPPPSRPLLAFGDSKAWILTEPLVYVIGATQDRIVVPAGFVTDMASIPQAFWGFPLFLTPNGQYSRAAIIHDYLYWSQQCSRDQADRLLVIAMKESSVGAFDEAVIYQGVHRFGLEAWRVNANDRRGGVPRVLEPQHRSPPDPNMNWPTYRAQLMQAGVVGTEPVDTGEYCKYGDSTDVPG